MNKKIYNNRIDIFQSPINENVFNYNNNINHHSNPINFSINSYQKINPNYIKEKFFQIKPNSYSNLNNNNLNQRYIDENNKIKNTEPRNYNSQNLRNKIIYQTPKKDIRNSLDVSDINKYKINKLSNRQTNPLDPKYNYDWQMTEINENRKIKLIDFSEIGNHPKPLYKFNNEKSGKGLNTYDIIGAQPGTKSHISKLEIKYGRLMTNKKEDIDGSHPGSLIRGIQTKRKTNPLNPDYQFIGGESLEYGNEKSNKHFYDYKSLLDYYNKYSKITNPDFDKKNFNNKQLSKKEENEKDENLKINNFRKNNIIYNFGSDKRIYPREQYRSLDFKEKYNDNYKYDDSIYLTINNNLNNNKENLYFPRKHDKILLPYITSGKKEDRNLNNANEHEYLNLRNIGKYGKAFDSNNKMLQNEIKQFNNRFPNLK